MNSDTLDTKSDQELAATFAREVAQLGIVESHWGDAQGNAIYGYRPIGSDPLTTPWADVPPYCTSADAVLPHVQTFLEGSLFSRRSAFFEYIREQTPCSSIVAWPDCLGLIMLNAKLARVLVVALLRAKRASR